MGVVYVSERVLKLLEALDDRVAARQADRERLEEIPQVLRRDPGTVDLPLCIFAVISPRRRSSRRAARST